MATKCLNIKTLNSKSTLDNCPKILFEGEWDLLIDFGVNPVGPSSSFDSGTCMERSRLVAIDKQSFLIGLQGPS